MSRQASSRRLSGLTIAEGFRPRQRRVVIYRQYIYLRRLGWVSALLGRLPSADGYQPNQPRNGCPAERIPAPDGLLRQCSRICAR